LELREKSEEMRLADLTGADSIFSVGGFRLAWRLMGVESREDE
jgi:hypothetical protein